MGKKYKARQIQQLFGADIKRETFIHAEGVGTIPQAERQANGSINTRVWDVSQLPKFGERWGFLPKLSRPTVMTVFASKGGVLKSSLSLNIARMAALHNIKTCVVGLDVQGDSTVNLGFYNFDAVEDLRSIISIVDKTQGLYSVAQKRASLSQVIVKTELPPLDLIPETPQLAQLDRLITTLDRREWWLKDNVTNHLIKDYDLIIFDCSPNWNNLITCSLCASDIVLTPLECSISHFRNIHVFQELTSEFKATLRLGYKQIYVPTKLNSTRKLSGEIRSWYLGNIPGCMQTAIKDSVVGEESIASRISIPEYQPTGLMAADMREFLTELWARIEECHAAAPADRAVA